MNASERMAQWLAEEGLTMSSLARKLNCTPSHVGHLIARRRKPSRRVANLIERLSAQWPMGPIRSTEWDSTEVAA